MTDQTKNIESLDGPEDYDFRQLLDTIYEMKDIIVNIPEDQLDELKEGLQDRKAKDNAILKKKGILPVTEMLNFLAYKAIGKDNKELEGQLSVRIKLLPRRSIEILKLEIPSNEF